MPKYEFDARRYCQANMERMGKTPSGQLVGLLFIHAIDHRDVEIEELRTELATLRDGAVHIYNSGYHAGHHATVEGGYVDIHSSDMDTYHAEEVAELLAALVGEG